ncbi:MAG: hypothetical protein SXQ77_06680, partial [Halobacteria archaeon]|nr:hypothetical protein [Halobacteria archaeon]
ALFVIDEGCAYHDGQVLPTTPPPNFDLETTLESFERFEEREPDVLLYGHFGVNYDGAEAVPQHAEVLKQWVADIEEAWERHGDVDEVEEDILEKYAGDDELNFAEEQLLRRDVGGVLVYLGAV